MDNNMRADFFGPAGDTRWNQRRLIAMHLAFATTNWTFVTAKVSTIYSLFFARSLLFTLLGNRVTTWRRLVHSTISTSMQSEL